MDQNLRSPGGFSLTHTHKSKVGQTHVPQTPMWTWAVLSLSLSLSLALSLVVFFSVPI